MKAVIPTGGRGTRLRPLTFSTNKHFIPVGNKPLIYYPIEAVADAGIKDIAITYNPGWLNSVRNFLGTGRKWGVKFTYILQEKPLGLANIFQVCEEYMAGDKFLMHLGDNIFTNGIKEHVEHFDKEKPHGHVAMVKHPENTRLGVPYFNKKGQLKKYVEKPKKPPHNYAIPGLYFFDGEIYKCFKGRDKIRPSERGEYEIAAPFQWLIDKGYKVTVKEYQGEWLDPGKFDDWISANQYILDNHLKSDIKSRITKDNFIEGRVSVGKSCKIKNSGIRGPVSIGEGVEVHDSYIGPFTSISDGCEIRSSHVENSVLMKDVKILNVKQPINESLIGEGTEVVDEDGPTDWLKLYVGEKSKVKV